MLTKTTIVMAVALLLLPAANSQATIVDISITGFDFTPVGSVIQAGDTVRWTNMDGVPHTATAADLSWSTPVLTNGDTASIVFPVPGTEPYYCAVHPSMRDTLTVQTTGVDDRGASVPAEFSLDQNTPNPFNPSTSIAFTLPEQSHVTLTVYNVLGRTVRALMNGSRAAGRHTVVWDGRDDAGRNVASGIYFYTLATPDRSDTRRMVLVK